MILPVLAVEGLGSEMMKWMRWPVALALFQVPSPVITGSSFTLWSLFSPQHLYVKIQWCYSSHMVLGYFNIGLKKIIKRIYLIFTAQNLSWAQSGGKIHISNFFVHLSHNNFHCYIWLLSLNLPPSLPLYLCLSLLVLILQIFTQLNLSL